MALLDAGVMAALARVSASRREQDVAAPKPFASPRKLPAGPFPPKPGPLGPPDPGRGGRVGFVLPPPLPKEESEDSSSDSDGGMGGMAEPPKPAPPAGVPDVALLDAGVTAALARASVSRREQDVAAPKPFAPPQKLPAGPFAPKPGPPGPGRGGRLGFALPPPLPKKESEDSSSDDDDDSDGDGGGVAEPPNPKPAPPAGVPDVALLHAGVMAALARANLSREGEMTLFSKT